MSAEIKNWETKTISLGKVREGGQKIVEYKGTPLLPRVTNLDADCGCTKLKWVEDKKILQVTFKAGKIPNQVQGNVQPFNKRIFVTLADGTVDILILSGTKYR